MSLKETFTIGLLLSSPSLVMLPVFLCETKLEPGRELESDRLKNEAE